MRPLEMALNTITPMGMENDLSEKHCVPCEDKSGLLSVDEVENLKERIDQWSIVEDKEIEKTLKFSDFKSALSFVNKVGVIAEAEGHHPNICIHDWNKVTITLYTHSIQGLSENDFIVAAKIDEIPRQ